MNIWGNVSWASQNLTLLSCNTMWHIEPTMDPTQTHTGQHALCTSWSVLHQHRYVSTMWMAHKNNASNPHKAPMNTILCRHTHRHIPTACFLHLRVNNKKGKQSPPGWCEWPPHLLLGSGLVSVTARGWESKVMTFSNDLFYLRPGQQTLTTRGEMYCIRLKLSVLISTCSLQPSCFISTRFWQKFRLDLTV